MPWEQYQQVFDAIVLSKRWGDATAALQLLSHLQGDALNVALLLPMPRRASRKELTDTLSVHYGSPGILADYRRQFDKTVRKPGEVPSSFAIALETLAVKAFGDMGQTACLRLIRARFIAGPSSCELRRYLDSVPPETPIRDVVDQCRMWESHTDPEPTYLTYAVNESEHGAESVRVVTENKPNNSLDQVEELLKRVLAGLTPATPTPMQAPETPAMDKLVQLLIPGTQKRQPAPQAPADSRGLETMLRAYFVEQQPLRQ